MPLRPELQDRDVEVAPEVFPVGPMLRRDQVLQLAAQSGGVDEGVDHRALLLGLGTAVPVLHAAGELLQGAEPLEPKIAENLKELKSAYAETIRAFKQSHNNNDFTVEQWKDLSSRLKQALNQAVTKSIEPKVICDDIIRGLAFFAAAGKRKTPEAVANRLSRLVKGFQAKGNWKEKR